MKPAAVIGTVLGSVAFLGLATVGIIYFVKKGKGDGSDGSLGDTGGSDPTGGGADPTGGGGTVTNKKTFKAYLKEKYGADWKAQWKLIKKGLKQKYCKSKAKVNAWGFILGGLGMPGVLLTGCTKWRKHLPEVFPAGVTETGMTNAEESADGGDYEDCQGCTNCENRNAIGGLYNKNTANILSGASKVGL